MKKALIVLSLGVQSLLVASSSAESLSPPPIQWQQTIGGTAFDRATQMVETRDGSFVFGGVSLSPVSGNKSSPLYDTNIVANTNFVIGDPLIPTGGDYWLVKLTATGQLLWDRSYGRTNRDELLVLQQLPDGGFLLGGHSVVDSRTDPFFGPFGKEDIWLVRTDPAGAPLWNTLLYDDRYDRLSRSLLGSHLCICILHFKASRALVPSARPALSRVRRHSNRCTAAATLP